MMQLIITPKTKIYDLLDAYPELEDVLIELVPLFKKLKNPILRRTITRVTTLQQAAKVGEIPLEKIINRFREIVGNENLGVFAEVENTVKPQPDWFDTTRILKKFDAREVINEGGHPLDTVLRETKDFNSCEIYELITPFLPAPLIETLEKKGFESWIMKSSDGEYHSYFCIQ